MNILQLIPVATSLITAGAVGTVVEDMAKLAIPATNSVIGSYGRRLGADFIGAAAGAIVAGFVVKQVVSIIQTVYPQVEAETAEDAETDPEI